MVEIIMPKPELNPKQAALKGNAAQLAKILDASDPAKQAANMPELLSLKAGQKVGARRFTLVKPLGRGGMGVVWLAHDTQLDESVALKFLPPEIASNSVALNDLRRETVRSHKLTHPNIIRIHDFHQSDEAAFISMEYVDGETLSDRRLQQTQQVLSWDATGPIGAAVVRGLGICARRKGHPPGLEAGQHDGGQQRAVEAGRFWHRGGGERFDEQGVRQTIDQRNPALHESAAIGRQTPASDG